MMIAYKRDDFDFLMVVLAMVADFAAVFAGFLVATYVRFYTDFIPLLHDGYPTSTNLYTYGAVIASLLFVFIFRTLNLYRRPQVGSFIEVMPRLIRVIGMGILLSMVLAFVVHTEPQFSRIVIGLSFVSIVIFVFAERFLLFQLELLLARWQKILNKVLIVGADDMAMRLKETMESEPRLRTEVVGFISVGSNVAVPSDLIVGELANLDIEALIDRYSINQVVLVDGSIDQDKKMNIFLCCDKKMVEFCMVPSVFGMLTSNVEVRNIDGVPVIALGKWPLDYFWNRWRKRCLDIVGSTIGLLVSLPVMAVAAIVIKRQSPGPIFYAQERCGEYGESFKIYKLRTMHPDAEANTGPVWACPDDDRRIPIGKFLRSYNIDELPQFWNVFIGNMSLVGPRPERPFFVAQFKEDIGRYMWRHATKPGMTGWAQINGLRGNSSIQERVKYDLYYLENWSLVFDLKIIVRTFFNRKNAY